MKTTTAIDQMSFDHWNLFQWGERTPLACENPIAGESAASRGELKIHKAFAPALLLLVTTVVTTLASVPAQAAVTDSFNARFDAHRGHLPLGHMQFALKPAKPRDCYIFTGKANPNMLAHLFIGKIREESRFCMIDGHIRPQFFRHHIDGAKDDSYTLTFDWPHHRVTYRSESGDKKTMKTGDQALDPLTLQIAGRRWLANSDDPAKLGQKTFTLVDKDDIKSYHLKVEGSSTIKTPAGRFKTFKVARVGSDHQLAFWMARDANWIPVRVEKGKGDHGSFQLNVSKLDQ